MNRFIFTTLLLFLITSVPLHLKAQPFAKEIAAFKKQDSASFPPKEAILLIGSSSFTLWKDVQSYFPTHTIVNRAFGGSTLLDVIRYTEDVVYPYQPKQILIYCGENDFAANDSLNPAQVTQRFINLFELIRSKDKKVQITYVSMKPSPSRKHLMPKYMEANRRIKNFLKKKKRTAYVDVYTAMLQKDGTPMTDIFLADNLHMNKKGYAIWQKIIEPYLLK